MVYTIKLNLRIDEDGVTSTKEIENLLYDALDAAAIDVTDVEILDIND